MGYGCVMPLSTIVQLYVWGELEYLVRETIDQPPVNNNLYRNTSTLHHGRESTLTK